MKIVFVTNDVSFHQSYLASCINSVQGVEYTYICSNPLLKNEQKMRLSANEHYDFKILVAVPNTKEWDEARKLICESDVCLVGSENHAILKGIDRVYLRYSEHIFKTPLWYLNPKTYLRFPKMLYSYRKEARKGWLLCASSHAKFDYNFYCLYKNRCLKFGYFPKANVELDLSTKTFPSEKKDELKIIFAGRCIKWKHPEKAFYLTERLLAMGFNCKLTVVSHVAGIKSERLLNRIKNKHQGLFSSGRVKLIDEMPYKDLMSLFADAHILIFPSDNGEGFGATLYEAMSSKMVVIANKKAGSTNLLVKNGINGFSYTSKRELDKIISYISGNIKCLEPTATSAKRFIDSKYSAKVAAQNLIEFVKSNYTKLPPTDEPLSKL